MEKYDKGIIKREVAKIRKEIEEENKIENISEVQDKPKETYRKFDTIYEKYGAEAYRRYVPQKYRKEDISNLLDEKRFIELLNKHGERAFYGYEDYIKEEEIEYELEGDYVGKALKKIQHIYIPNIFRRLLQVVLSVCMGTIPLVTKNSAIQTTEKDKYEKEITEYIGEVEDYGKKIKSYNLTDIQNIMIVTSDMWERINGYGKPKIDLISYPGLDVSKDGGIGVCRNMADDTARRLNAINKDYNARTIVVYENLSPKDWKFPDIKMEVADEGEKATESQNQNEKYLYYLKSLVNVIQEKGSKIMGNHMVVLMDSSTEGVELVVDPTNGGIGIFNDGRIYMFNMDEQQEQNLYYVPYGSTQYGIDKVAEIPQNYLSSIGIIKKEKLERLEKEYSVEAQNKALREAKSIVYGYNNFTELLRVKTPHRQDKNIIKQGNESTKRNMQRKEEPDIEDR